MDMNRTELFIMLINLIAAAMSFYVGYFLLGMCNLVYAVYFLNKEF